MKTEMSKQEARRITIIEELLAGRFTNKQAAVASRSQCTPSTKDESGGIQKWGHEYPA
jgi:hypothetical protein